MRQLFEPDIDLKPCCGINAIFVRAPAPRSFTKNHRTSVKLL
jgi:hypothetical protein